MLNNCSILSAYQKHPIVVVAKSRLQVGYNRLSTGPIKNSKNIDQLICNQLWASYDLECLGG